jgi:uncharacterized membrane protein YbhN (UPF0104 family)
MFDSINYKLFGLSLVLIILGYICLAQGPVDNHLSLSLAPLILVVTYCILLPIAIIWPIKQKEEDKKKNK